MSTEKFPIYEETGLEHCWNGTDPGNTLGSYKNWPCKGTVCKHFFDDSIPPERTNF